MEPAEDLLRRLACNDEKAVSMVLGQRPGGGEAELPPKVELLVQLAAFLAVGAAIPVLRETTMRASAQGATVNEIVAVLVAVGPALGVASLVAEASRLAVAVGYGLEDGPA
jgi:4-carboxymuconolactone decarboxylase